MTLDDITNVIQSKVLFFAVCKLITFYYRHEKAQTIDNHSRRCSNRLTTQLWRRTNKKQQ